MGMITLKRYVIHCEALVLFSEFRTGQVLLLNGEIPSLKRSYMGFNS